MLREKCKVKTVEGNTQFSLTAPAGKAYRIQDVHVSTPSSQYATLNVDRTVVGYFRVGGGTLGNHLPFPIADEENTTLYRLMLDRGISTPIPVASGETFSITGVHQATSTVTVVYDEYDASDVRNTEPNGSQSNRFQFINYGRYSTTLADGDNKFTTQQTTSQYPAFPFGETVPAKTKARILGVVASDVNRYSASNNKQKTKYLRMVRNRKVLFDDSLNGHPFIGSGTFTSNITSVGNGISAIGNYDDTDRRLPLMFENPLEFGEGEALEVFVNTDVVTGVANLPAASVEVGLIMDVQLLQ